MRERSFARGLIAGVVVKLVWTVVFTLVLATVFRNAPAGEGSASAVPWAPFSSGWYLARVVVLVGSVLAGIAVAYGSARGSWTATVVLAGAWLVWAAVAPGAAPMTTATLVQGLVSPVGILLGAFGYRRWEAARAA